MLKRLALLGVGTLLLAGCASGAPASEGSKTDQQAAPSPTPSGPVVTGLGEYAFEASGATGVITLPGTADPLVSESVTLAQAPEPTYVSVSVDNRQGAQDVALGGVSVYTVAGKKVTYQAASKYLNTLDDSALSTEDGNKIIRAYNTLLKPVSVGESREVTMVGTEPLPEDIVRVTVANAYGDETEATKK